MGYHFTEHQKNEEAVASLLVKTILDSGRVITVCDGEEDVLARSHKFDDVMNALNSTDSDVLRVSSVEPVINGIRHSTKYRGLGAIVLVWGNDADLISDYTDNIGINILVQPAMKLAEQINDDNWNAVLNPSI